MNVPEKNSGEINSKDFFSTYSGRILFLLLVIYLVIASLQSLVPHYWFFTNNWDLGFHNQAMYHYAHFEAPGSTLWNPQFITSNLLGDHFTLLQAIDSQLYWIFGSYSLLIAQIIYTIIGAIGLFRLTNLVTGNSLLSLIAVLLMITHYSLYAALAFDNHDNVSGMMFLPWILFYYHQKKWSGLLIFLTLFLVAREDLAFTGMAMGFTLVLFDRKSHFKFGLAIFFISASYFIIVFYLLIPNISPPPWGYNAWRFKSLGNNIPEAVQTIIRHPLHTIGLFFDKSEKIDKWFYFLLTGGVWLVFNPKYFLIFIPTFGITCFSDEWPLWGNMYHYNIVFAVILPLVAVTAANQIISVKKRHLFLVLVVGLNIFALSKNYIFHDWTKFNRIFKAGWYNRRDNLAEIREGLSLIPDTASVSATNHLTTRLAFREKAYFYPDVKDAEYIAINEADAHINPFPFSTPEDFMNSMNGLMQNQEYELIFKKNKIYIFKKIQIQVQQQ